MMKANKSLQIRNHSAVHFLQVKSTADLTITVQFYKFKIKPKT